MRRSDIVLADLEPVTGSEADKTRPVVVIGRDAHTSTSVSRGRGVVTIIPLTTNVSRIFAFQALLPAHRTGLDHDSKAQTEQIRSIDVSRLRHVVGTVPSDLMERVEAGLRLHLSL